MLTMQLYIEICRNADGSVMLCKLIGMIFATALALGCSLLIEPFSRLTGTVLTYDMHS